VHALLLHLLATMPTRSLADVTGGRGFDRGVLLMFRVVFVVVALLVLTVQAEARPHTYLHRVQHFQQAMAMTPGEERIIGGRPSGCPNAFCGCEASLYRFGHIIPGLNLAGNWQRFPRAAPAPGMAAVRSGHVMILQQQVAGDVWYVHDGNSGGHVTREHPRSIAGYIIVDPSSESFASSGFTGPSVESARPSAGFSRPSRLTKLTTTSSSHSWKDSQARLLQEPLFAN
jgi:hypothetical protein